MSGSAISGARTRAIYNRSLLFACIRKTKFGLCSSLLTSVVLCLLSFLSSHSSCFLAKCKGNGAEESVLFFSAPVTEHQQHQQQLVGTSSVVTHRRYSSKRLSVKEKALQTHTGVWFSMSLSAYLNTCLGQGSSWLMAAVAAEKQSEVRGCWHEISAPSMKIRRITSSEIHHPCFWIWKSSISNTVCTGFHGCFTQVPRI